jgi:hypothetical protein
MGPAACVGRRSYLPLAVSSLKKRAASGGMEFDFGSIE